MTTGNLADYMTDWYSPRKPTEDSYELPDYCEECGAYWREAHASDCGG
jgi:hypothetical protein